MKKNFMLPACTKYLLTNYQHSIFIYNGSIIRYFSNKNCICKINKTSIVRTNTTSILNIYTPIELMMYDTKENKQKTSLVWCLKYLKWIKLVSLSNSRHAFTSKASSKTLLHLILTLCGLDKKLSSLLLRNVIYHAVQNTMIDIIIFKRL